MDLCFTQADLSDLETIFSLCRELVEQYEDPAQVDIPRALAWCRRKISACIGQYTRVTLNGQTVGYYHFSRSGGEMELDDVYVLPPFQGQGIGSAMVARCCAGTDRAITLCVFRENAGAIRLYRRFGFNITDTIGSTRITMRREAV